jgi:MFS family permease
VRRAGHLRRALGDAGFRRLFAVRLACQFGDGVFQAGLAGAVLFDPQRQARAAEVAAAFAVLLVPYSLIGPFAGVLLDRWWRQRVLVWANLARVAAVPLVSAEIAGAVSGPALYASALVIISLSRFLLCALGAALPSVVPDPELVTTNAISATVGTIATAVGGAAAIGVRAGIGSSNGDYALIAVAALVPYALAALVAGGFARTALGPSAAQRAARETAREVARGLLAGVRRVRGCPPVADALAAIAAQRLCYGIWTVCTVLLYRNRFTGGGLFPAGLTGLGQVVAGVALGGALAALVTPAAFRRLGAVRWPALMLAAAGVLEIVLGLPYRKPLVLLAAVVLAFTAQAVKISVDTLVQHHLEDAYRGRVFALYDTLFNLAIVLAAALTAAVLPDDGHAPAAVLVVGAAYVLTAAAYLRRARRTTPAVRPPPRRARADRVPSAAPAGADTHHRRAGRAARRGSP